MCFMCSLRPAGSTPCLLPTSPRDDAVGTVFGAEPSNCTGGTFARVDARFTGAPNIDSAEKTLGAVLWGTKSPYPHQDRVIAGICER